MSDKKLYIGVASYHTFVFLIFCFIAYTIFDVYNFTNTKVLLYIFAFLGTLGIWINALRLMRKSRN